jgi:hypothetical protein
LWWGYKKPPQRLKDAKNRQGFLSAQVGVVTALVTGVMCIPPFYFVGEYRNPGFVVLSDLLCISIDD